MVGKEPRGGISARTGFCALAAGALLLAGCTGQKMAKLVVCDGKHRRDANIYGSVLPGSTLPPVTAPATAGKPVASVEHQGFDRSAATAPPVTYPSC